MATKKAAAKSPAKTPAKKSVPAKAPAKSAAKKSAATPKAPATHKQIADLAHKYHTERGHSHGNHVEDWLRAEKELNS